MGKEIQTKKAKPSGLQDCMAQEKMSLPFTLERKLFENGATAVLLDGSSVRSGLNNELDFSPTDSAEHLRRVAHVCKLLNDPGNNNHLLFYFSR